jgi:hypothetical protein
MVLCLYQEQKHQHSQPLPPSAVAGGGLLASYAIAQCSKETEYHRLFAVTALAFDVVCAAQQNTSSDILLQLCYLSLSPARSRSHTLSMQELLLQCACTHTLQYTKKLLLHGVYTYIFIIEPAYD